MSAHADPRHDPALEPLDEHNLDLLEQVRPRDWNNPPLDERYHLVVLGGGTAGLVTASAAAILGARVALVERRLLGGDCLNFGCVPSKALIRAARAWHAARTAAENFSGPSVASAGDFSTVMRRLRRLRADISRHDSAERFAALGVDVFLGEARFVGRRRIEIDGRQTRFRRAVIATGARPSPPPIPGLETTPHYNNETIFTLSKLPPRLAVIGAGAIGCELAQCFARFGSEVTVFDIAQRALPADDPEAAAIVQRSLGDDGVRFRFGATIEEVGRDEAGTFLRLGEGQHRTDALLVAAGRRPNVEGLGLGEAGIELEGGRLAVDDRLRTSNRRVYAIGDVAARHQFTHVADAQARLTVQNALFFGRGKASELVVPWCTYTSPEVAHVGLTVPEAERREIAIQTLTLPLTEVDRAVLDDATDGFLRVHTAKGKDRILGATLVAENAGDIIGELSLAVTHGVGLSQISSTIHPYPTQAEVVRKIADQWRRGKLTPWVKRLFSFYFRLLR